MFSIFARSFMTATRTAPDQETPVRHDLPRLRAPVGGSGRHQGIWKARRDD
ncbi:hypothetical protein [Maliponia aquimaris]|uniref:Uncharacterized protein n=1 Tax=Maliponia aquimaris TaxID=1673631 RepID=A0A238KY25_9RHOB|nr:hypothetical protein [Maliponia aquimaris]SMX47471.1 hypothetical protein MAA8898_03666 [Maliponia aquimaris]